MCNKHTSARNVNVKTGFHIVVSGLLQFEISSKTVNDYMETSMKFLQRPITTLKDSESQRPTLKDRQRPCHFICVIWKQNKIPLVTANDAE